MISISFSYFKFVGDSSNKNLFALICRHYFLSWNASSLSVNLDAAKNYYNFRALKFFIGENAKWLTWRGCECRGFARLHIFWNFVRAKWIHYGGQSLPRFVVVANRVAYITTGCVSALEVTITSSSNKIIILKSPDFYPKAVPHW